MPFAENLVKIQALTKMSNYKLAKFLGCSQTSVANWISGSRTPHDKARAVIADAFGLSLPEIDGELPDGWKEIVMRKIKSPAPKSESGTFPVDYYKLTPKNRAIADTLLAQLLASQSDE